eukprot:TRINITY_DN13246_c0_g1_i2.p1 TRINITY_DN13246_c0_g1~~TRINITY_DN13246_c0_g1_i2.p1  ORF type:complete len:604 (+),score=128.85 TRINITY_DN13246_c0_g1_i2:23-1834(+)
MSSNMDAGAAQILGTLQMQHKEVMGRLDQWQLRQQAVLERLHLQEATTWESSQLKLLQPHSCSWARPGQDFTSEQTEAIPEVNGSNGHIDGNIPEAAAEVHVSDNQETEKDDTYDVDDLDDGELDESSAKRNMKRSATYDLAKEESQKRRNEKRLSLRSEMSFYTDFMTSESEAAMSCRYRLHKLVKSWKFETFFAVVIITNSLFLGIQLEWQATHLNQRPPDAFGIIQTLYSALFLVELLLRVAESGVRAWICSRHWAWNWLDVFVVLLSVFEICTAMLDGGEAGANASSNFRILRIIRVTRLVRVVRIIRVLRFIRALRTLVYSILATLKSLMWAMLLLILIIYVFSIMFTDAAISHLEDVSFGEVPFDPQGNEANLHRHFGTLHTSMHTLFRSISGGLTWSDAVSSLVLVGWWWVYLFSLYIAFCCFAVLNVMTGVFCQNAIQGAERDQEMVIASVLADKQKFKSSIEELFSQIDDDGSGQITIDEFEEHFDDQAVRTLFEALELGAADAWTLFRSLDQDGNHRIDSDEFLEGCCHLRGTAKSVDLAAVKKLTVRLREQLGEVQEQQSQLAEVIQQLPELIALQIPQLGKLVVWHYAALC